MTMAAAASSRAAAAFYVAWTDLYWGRMHVARRAPGDAERARSLLTKAQETGEANGYGNVEMRARVALSTLS